jgi:hypothetical protein
MASRERERNMYRAKTFLPQLALSTNAPFVECDPVRARGRAGGVLADATGTGKTRTMLEHIRRDWLAKKAGPTLILTPCHICMQWKKECDKWIPDVPVLVLYGPKHKQQTDFSKFGIVLTTNMTFSRQRKDYASLAIVPCPGKAGPVEVSLFSTLALSEPIDGMVMLPDYASVLLSSRLDAIGANIESVSLYHIGTS